MIMRKMRAEKRIKLSMKNFWKKTGWLGLAVLACAICMVAQIVIGVIAMLPASFLAGIEASRLGMTDVAQITEFVADAVMEAAPIGIFAYHIVGIIGFGLWYYFGCGRPRPGKVTEVLRPKTILVVLLCGFGLNLLANAFVMLAPYFAPRAMEHYMALVEAAGFGINAFTVVASVLLAPVGEELLCRGVIFHYAKKVTTGMKNDTLAFWIANGIQALLFGVIHGNFIQGSYAFVLGLGLGVLVKRYHSLYPAILGHFVINFLSTFVMQTLLGPLPEGILWYCLVGVAGILALGAAYYLGKDKNVMATS